jgi:hypothetical protein
VRGWALTAVDAVRVGHMRLVIRRVEVFTIPAGREKDLGPEAVWAAGVGESWSLWSRRSGIVEANSCLVLASGAVRRSGNQPVPGDCLGFRGAGVGSCERVSCEHAKAVWEFSHGLIWGASLEIVTAQLIRVLVLFKRCRKHTRAFHHE